VFGVGDTLGILPFTHVSRAKWRSPQALTDEQTDPTRLRCFMKATGKMEPRNVDTDGKTHPTQTTGIATPKIKEGKTAKVTK
jgi:hypothetical protein